MQDVGKQIEMLAQNGMKSHMISVMLMQAGYSRPQAMDLIREHAPQTLYTPSKEEQTVMAAARSKMNEVIGL